MALIDKINKIHEEYTNYRNYYNKFEEEVMSEGKADLTKKINDKDFDKAVEDFYFKKMVLKVTYQGDINLLYNRLHNLVEAARIEEQKIPEDVEITLKKDYDKKFHVRLFMDKDEPAEIEEGYLDNLRKELKETYKLDKLIENLKNQ